MIEQFIVEELGHTYIVVDMLLQVQHVGGSRYPFGDSPAVGTSLLDLFPELYGSESQLFAILDGELPRLRLPEINRDAPDGSIRYYDFLFFPARQPTGEITGLIHVLSDVTERGRREQLYVQQRNESGLLRERVVQQNMELARVNAELRRATHLKDEFLAGMSHEVRTPLTAILGLTELMRSQMIGPLSETQIDTMRRIEESGRHLLALINDFLDIAKIETGRFDLDPVVISIYMLCQSSVRMVSELATKKQMSIELEIDPQISLIRGDERRLRQALINLLSNAIKFTPAGGRVGLRVAASHAEGVARFIVWDTGVGIAAEDSARLFQPFVQIPGEHQRQQTGSGLGLALVAQLVKLHGGGVSLDSVLGHGSRFTIALPWSLDQEKLLSPFLGQAAPSLETLTEHELQPVHIPESLTQRVVLLVEDDQATAHLLVDYLGRCGYRVVHVGSGEEALALVREEVPGLVLMDIRLQGIDGLETIQRMRQVLALQSVPMVALTALAMPGDQERCLAAGANVYLSKPIHLRRLVEVLSDLIQQSMAEVHPIRLP